MTTIGRRQFLQWAALAAVGAAGWWHWGRSGMMSNWIQRAGTGGSRGYPGPVLPLNRKTIKQQGRWQG